MAKLVEAKRKIGFGLSNNQLKIIAILSMLIDHIGVELYPTVEYLRIIGRLALPLFAYMIAEGCFYTKNRVVYLCQLLLLGVLCQAVFYYTTGSLYQGILITFSLSVMMIFSIEAIIKSCNVIKIILGTLGLTVVALVAFVAPVSLRNRGFELDYGYWGMLLPVAIYFAPNRIAKLIACAFMLVLLGLEIQGVQFYALCTLPLLALYNGTRGTAKLKYVFYVFYPLHLIAIYLVSITIF
jgi:hypothetical protein